MGCEPIDVAELFAGVGGFRLGLEGKPDSPDEKLFKIVFSNQWEPGRKKQWASDIYQLRFGEQGHTNQDIHQITDGKKSTRARISQYIPPHQLLVGGFPCQDYSVARTTSGELGIEGEKGKLWIPIKRIIQHMNPRPAVIFLENVSRLLNSPAKSRGLNFSVILGDLINLGYDVEWRVITASEYGFPQKRKRVFIMAYNTNLSKADELLPKISHDEVDDWILGKESSKKISPFTSAFPVEKILQIKQEKIPSNLSSFSDKQSVYNSTGYASKSMFWTAKVIPRYHGKEKILGDILQTNVDNRFLIDSSRLEEWRYMKGSKNEFRLRKRDRSKVDKSLVQLYDKCMTSPFNKRKKIWAQNRSVFEDAVGVDSFYKYNEGTMDFDKKTKPSRTIITAEIGKTPSRSRHIIQGDNGLYRRLTPVEVERLNGFPDDWTKIEGITDSTRGFLMGNALVIGIIERLRNPLAEIIQSLTK